MIMYLSAQERTYGGPELELALMTTVAATESTLGVEVPAALSVVEAGRHTLLQNGDIDEGSIGFKIIYSLFMDRTHEKTAPLMPDFAACYARPHSPSSVRTDKIIEALATANVPFADDSFDISAFVPHGFDATIVLPGTPDWPHRLHLTRPLVRKLAMAAISAVAEAPSSHVRAIEALCQPRPNLFAGESAKVFPHYMQANGINGYGIGILTSWPFRDAASSRFYAPLRLPLPDR